jgi:hypothetical protein
MKVAEVMVKVKMGKVQMVVEDVAVSSWAHLC